MRHHASTHGRRNAVADLRASKMDGVPVVDDCWCAAAGFDASSDCWDAVYSDDASDCFVVVAETWTGHLVVGFVERDVALKLNGNNKDVCQTRKIKELTWMILLRRLGVNLHLFTKQIGKNILFCGRAIHDGMRL